MPDKKLHILFLTSWFPSKVFPTNGNFILKHAEAIAIRNIVTVVYPIGNKLKKENNYSIESSNKNNLNCIVIYFKKHSFFLVNFFRKFKALQVGMKQVGSFDLIHANVLLPIGIFVVYLMKKYKKKYIFSEHWSGFLPQKDRSLNIFKRQLLKYIVKNAAYIVPVSNTLKDAMISLGLRGNYQVIGNAINTELFVPKKKKVPTATLR